MLEVNGLLLYDGARPPAEMRQHNYVRKMVRMAKHGELPASVGLHGVDIAHDNWCGVFKGKRCNCDPDIRLCKHIRVS